MSAAVKAQLQSILRHPGGSYLFQGYDGLGKFSAAAQLAQSICVHAADTVVLENEKPSIGIAEIHQLRQSLQLKSRQAKGHRMIIVRDAEKLTREAQNALLKLLEEPPYDTTIILTTSQLDKLLPTVISRCKMVRFAVPKTESVEALIKRLTKSQKAASAISGLAQGRPATAVRLIEDESYRNAIVNIHNQSRTLLSGDIYQALLATSNVNSSSAAKQHLHAVAAALRKIIQKNPTDINEPANQLRTVGQLLRYLDANGNYKFALDKLVLEVSR